MGGGSSLSRCSIDLIILDITNPDVLCMICRWQNICHKVLCCRRKGCVWDLLSPSLAPGLDDWVALHWSDHCRIFQSVLRNWLLLQNSTCSFSAWQWYKGVPFFFLCQLEIEHISLILLSLHCSLSLSFHVFWMFSHQQSVNWKCRLGFNLQYILRCSI